MFLVDYFEQNFSYNIDVVMLLKCWPFAI